jgi:hypothetical protein
VHVPGDDPIRDADVLGVRPIVEQQVFAQVFLAALAVVTDAAGRRIRGDDALSTWKSETSLPTAATSPASSWPNNAGGRIIFA